MAEYNPAGAQVSLNALEAQLSAAPKLNSNGRRLLELIRSGPVLEEGAGAFADGLLLNFSDEIIGGVVSILGSNDELTGLINQYRTAKKQSPLSSYDVATAMERRGRQKYREEYPLRAAGYELGGALVPSFIPGVGQANLGRAVATAAASGAASGIGASEKNENILTDAVVGGTTGGLTAGALNQIQKLAGAGYRSLTQPGAASRGRSQADEMMREAIGADTGSMVTASGRMADAAASGKPMTLADIGPNTRGLVDAANLVPGEARKKIYDFLRRRDAGQVERLTADLQSAFGPRARFFPEFNAMKAARARQGNKLYGVANKRNIPVTDELLSVMGRPSVQRAIDRAKELAAEDGIKLPAIRIDENTGRLVDSVGDAVTDVQTQFLHYVKMGLDDVVFVAKSPAGGLGPTAANKVGNTRMQLLEIMDAANPMYKRARDRWAGETAAMNSMKSGRNFLREDIDELADGISKMSKSEKEAFRVGAMQGLMDRIEASVDTANIARNLLKTERNKKLIRLTFDQGEKGTRSFNNFINRLSDEVEMKVTSSQVLGNSATQARKVAYDRLVDGARRQVPQGGGVTDFIVRALRSGAKDLEERQIQSAADRIATVMTQGDPAQVGRIMRQLEPPGGVQRLLEGLRDLLPATARTATSPYTVGVMTGGAAPNIRENLGL